MSYSLFNHSQITANIDQLVRYILFNKVNVEYVRMQVSSLYLPIIYSYDSSWIYTPTIHAFIGSAQQVAGSLYPIQMVWNNESTQDFIDVLYVYKESILRNDSSLCQKKANNRLGLETYINQLLDHYSRLLFVRVDLKYIQEVSHLMTIEDFNDHMNELRGLIGRARGCFKDLQGNAWALEQGNKSGGFHCHLLLIYDGARQNNDWYLAEEVGKKWCAITEGLGIHYNCSNPRNKRNYLKEDGLGNNLLGIGMIHRNHPNQIKNAVNVALYLAKPDKQGQHLKVWLPNMRTFSHGIYYLKRRRGLLPRAK